MTGSESVLTYGAPNLKLGAGSGDEVGHDLSRYGEVRRVLVGILTRSLELR